MLSVGAGVARLLNLDGPDVGAFMIASLIGFMVDFYLPHGPWSGYVAVAVAYHLFLAWLVITADHETGMSLSVAGAALMHLACLGVICGIGVLRHSVPYFDVIRMIPGFSLLRYGVAGFAVFERNWLFIGGKKRPEKEPVVENALSTMASQEDYEAWVCYLGQPDRYFRSPGVSIKAEYQMWLQARTQYRAMGMIRETYASGA